MEVETAGNLEYGIQVDISISATLTKCLIFDKSVIVGELHATSDDDAVERLKAMSGSEIEALMKRNVHRGVLTVTKTINTP